ncbi:MAG: M1 family metallopeptidase [Chitinophagales bacterium]|nr:M1 family metallopeptidase [Chitinophagales bacterium]
MKHLLSFLVLFGISFFASAQLLPDEEKAPTLADTLRGMLLESRACYDVGYYELTVKVHPDSQFIEGVNMMTLRATTDFTQLQFDLFENMQIKQVTFDDEVLDFQRAHNAVFITTPALVKQGTTHHLRIDFSGKPIVAKTPPWDGGFVWEHDKNGNPWIGVACEGIGASLWWPNKDHLSDEPDSMKLHIIVPDSLVAVGNGQLISITDAAAGWKQYNWRVSYPINNYNVTLNIGKYAYFNDSYMNENGNLALNYYVLEHNLQKAKKHFEQVKPMLKCFEEYLGEFPFWRDGYKLVESPYLGMEHQSAIAYGNGYQKGYAGMDFSYIGLDFDYIIIHETGHEWWGNSVSCSDIADLWIHEGFCTYSEALYVECLHGRDTALAYINAKKNHVENQEPVIGTYNINREGSGDMYNKGMLLLHTLRSIIQNDKVWFSIIKGIATDFKYKTTSTAEIEANISEKAGRDLSYFFNQYLRHAKLPVFEYRLRKKNKLLDYRWVADVSDFKMPVRVTTSPNTFKEIEPTTAWQTMNLWLGKKDTFLVADDLFYIEVKKVKN